MQLLFPATSWRFDKSVFAASNRSVSAYVIFQRTPGSTFELHTYEIQVPLDSCFDPAYIAGQPCFTPDQLPHCLIFFQRNPDTFQSPVLELPRQLEAVHRIVLAVELLVTSRHVCQIDQNILYSKLTQAPVRPESAESGLINTYSAG